MEITFLILIFIYNSLFISFLKIFFFNSDNIIIDNKDYQKKNLVGSAYVLIHVQI